MALKILIISDKFKGTLPAGAAAEAIASGWRQARPRDSLDVLPMTDGGDGFGAVMSGLLRARAQRLLTVDAAHRPSQARWWWEPESRTAIIESAAVIGLAALPPGRFHPFELGTFGLGAVIRAARAKGARRCWIGIGGSATNDGGFGLARALGWEFLDGDSRPIEHWTGLHRLSTIRAPAVRHWFDQFLVAVDVQNPLLGRRGATRVYGPQKGLRPRDFARAERCLRRLAQVVKRDFRRDLASAPGAGAAGGLGFGLQAFGGARLQSGFDLFARQSSLQRRLRSADLVIVAEGAIDSSTFMGKGVGQVARRCQNEGIPCIALAGVLGATPMTRRLLTQTHALTQLTTIQEAKANPARWLRRLAALVARSADDSVGKQRSPSPRPSPAGRG